MLDASRQMRVLLLLILAANLTVAGVLVGMASQHNLEVKAAELERVQIQQDMKKSNDIASRILLQSLRQALHKPKEN
jgi:uncharacterized lipoprotein YajG